jgi:hypothetical protein
MDFSSHPPRSGNRILQLPVGTCAVGSGEGGGWPSSLSLSRQPLPIEFIYVGEVVVSLECDSPITALGEADCGGWCRSCCYSVHGLRHVFWDFLSES